MVRPVFWFFLFFFLQFRFAGAYDGRADSTGNRRWYLPHYLPFQFAGNIGFLSTGLGYKSNKENYELTIVYGYVPRAIGQHEIHMITARNIFPVAGFLLKKDQTLIPYLGLGLMVETGGHAFFTLPSHYPEGYYDFPKNLHVTAFGGAKVQYAFPGNAGPVRGLEIFAEAGTIDVYVWYKLISNEIKFNQIFSLALGINVMLDW